MTDPEKFISTLALKYRSVLQWLDQSYPKLRCATIVFSTITSTLIKLQSRSTSQIAGNFLAVLKLMDLNKIDYDLSKILSPEVDTFFKI